MQLPLLIKKYTLKTKDYLNIYKSISNWVDGGDARCLEIDNRLIEMLLSYDKNLKPVTRRFVMSGLEGFKQFNTPRSKASGLLS